MHPNLHTPERGANESQADYRMRQRASKRAVNRMVAGTTDPYRTPSGKVHRKQRGDSGQHPKFKAERKHRQHVHPLRDEHGDAYTRAGREPRRMWVAGISALKGY